MSRVRRKAKKKGGRPAPEPDAARERVSPRQIPLLIGLTIAVAGIVLAVHWPALSAEATSFDDGQYLTRNYLVQNPSWKSAGRFLGEVLEPSTVRGYYQPLAMISLMLDHAIGGRADNLRPFHRTSLVLHAANTVLVIVLLYMLFGRAWPAAVVGLLFGLHPLTVEPVAWVGERKTLLAMFFALWCLLLYVGHARRMSWKAYAGCLLMYVLALMSKPTSIPLPVLMLLLDYWPLGRLGRRAVMEKLPFLIIGGAFGAVTFISQDRTASTTLPGEYPPTRIPLTVCHNLIFYLYKILWPANLSSHYPVPEPLTLERPMVLAGAIGTCLLIPALLISLRWTRALFTGWLFFFTAILPTMGVVGFTIVIASDKFAYLPSVGLLLVLAWLFSKLWSARTKRVAPTARRIGIAAVVVIVAAAESVATRRHLAHWRDTECHYRHMITLAPRASILHLNLGNHFLSQDRVDEGIEQLERALELKPDSFRAHNNLANALVEKNRIEEAVPHYHRALEIKPDFADAYNGLGIVLARKGDFEAAIVHYEKALEINPDYPEAHNSLGAALAPRGEIDRAMMHFRKALEINRNYAEAHNNAAILLIWQGKADEAIQTFRRSLRIQPLDADTHCNLAELLGREGRIVEALAEYNEALRINPGHAKAREGLNGLRGQGQYPGVP